MRAAKIILSILMISAISKAWAGDGSDIPSCKGVTDVCIKTGYIFAGHPSGKGLWADCVMPLSHANPVTGVSGIDKAKAAQCMKDNVAARKKVQGLVIREIAWR